jgi:hypothetical protein
LEKCNQHTASLNSAANCCRSRLILIDRHPLIQTFCDLSVEQQLQGHDAHRILAGGPAQMVFGVGPEWITQIADGQRVTGSTFTNLAGGAIDVNDS